MKERRNKKMWIFWIAISVVIVVGGALLLTGNWLVKSGHDYSDLSWTDAFEQLHAQFSLKYPFTEWKKIDWDALYEETAPRIARAESVNDKEAFYLAIREYVFSIPDAHVQLGGPNMGLQEAAIGGGYGLGIIELDDERVIVHVLLEEGPAEKAGIIWGAEIVEWNGQPIQDAIEQTSLVWSEGDQATAEGIRIAKLLYLVRDSVGTKISVTFKNPGETSLQTVEIVAIDDDLETLKIDLVPEKDLSAIFRAPIQYEILENGYGYINIIGFMPTLGGIFPEKIVEKAVSVFIEANVPGIFIDVRGNVGGLDALVPKIAGHFFEESSHYEYVSLYNSESGKFEIDPNQNLMIEPSEPHYDGPVVVLVDNYTISTAEGIPLVIQSLEKGYVAGFYGTNGSFAVGNPGDNVYRLPEGLGVNFLGGRALDENENILIDSNADGAGGIVPDIRVPLTEENVRLKYVEGVDIVLETAIKFLETME